MLLLRQTCRRHDPKRHLWGRKETNLHFFFLHLCATIYLKDTKGARVFCSSGLESASIFLLGASLNMNRCNLLVGDSSSALQRQKSCEAYRIKTLFPSEQARAFSPRAESVCLDLASIPLVVSGRKNEPPLSTYNGYRGTVAEISLEPPPLPGGPPLFARRKWIKS